MHATNSVGAEFLPIVQNVADTIQSNMPQIKAAVMPVIQGIGNAIKFVANNLNILIPIATACVSVFVAMKVINGVIATIQTLRIVIGAVTKVQGIWNAVTMANPIGLIAVGVGALIGAIALLVLNWDKVTNSVKRAVEAVKNFLHIKPKNIKVDSSGQAPQNDGAKVDGSHADGLANVPFNGYIAELHKGERVLTAGENKTYNTNTNNTNTNKQITVNFYGDIIGDESFLQKLENRFTQKLRAELGAL